MPGCEPRGVLAVVLAAVALTLATSACGVARRAVIGEQCSINSECDAPLVCRIGRCRHECRSSEDCIAPLACVLDEDRIGACQLESERECARASDCPAPLICSTPLCLNQCTTDRDCVTGARCIDTICVDPAVEPCASPRDCRLDQTCLHGRCRPQCRADVDCDNGYRCDHSGPDPLVGVCRAASIDGGALDGGRPDGGGGDDGGVTPTGCVGGPLGDVVAFDLYYAGGCAIVDGVTTGVTPGVYCWGEASEEAFFGLPSSAVIVQHPCATRVMPLGTTVYDEIALAWNAGCVRAGSNVRCWGEDGDGQVPDGVVAMTTPVPADIIFPSAIARLSAESSGAGFAWSPGGRMFAWGTSTTPLWSGTGSLTRYDVPTEITGLAMTPSIVVGTSSFVCASDSSDVVCTPTHYASTGTPIPAARALDVGNEHLCASDGTSVYCWGDDNMWGQLGNGSTTLPTTRVLVGGLPAMSVLDVSLGGPTSCALMADRSVWCWGRSEAIDPLLPISSAVLAPVQIMTGRQSIHVGALATCGLGVDRQLMCVARQAINAGAGTGTLTTPVFVQR